MPRAKKVEEVEAVEEVSTDSEAKVALMATIEVYKEQNPAKYELKKEALEAQLNTL